MGSVCSRKTSTPAAGPNQPVSANNPDIEVLPPEVELQAIDLSQVEEGKDFSFDGYQCQAKVTSVYDGDTLRVVFVYRSEVIQYKVRMLGYDSPEMRPLRSAPNREVTKAAALRAKAAISERVLGKIVTMKCGGFDKYGRLLATLYTGGVPEGGHAALTMDEQSVNDWMIASGYGVPYDGGTKATAADDA